MIKHVSRHRGDSTVDWLLCLVEGTWRIIPVRIRGDWITPMKISHAEKAMNGWGPKATPGLGHKVPNHS